MQVGSWTTRPTRSPGARACAARPTTTARCGHLPALLHWLPSLLFHNEDEPRRHCLPNGQPCASVMTCMQWSYTCSIKAAHPCVPTR